MLVVDKTWFTQTFFFDCKDATIAREDKDADETIFTTIVFFFFWGRQPLLFCFYLILDSKLILIIFNPYFKYKINDMDVG